MLAQPPKQSVLDPDSRAVSYDEWLDDMEPALLDLYEMLQEIAARTGRRILDRSACPIGEFCKFAYDHSTLYSVKERDAFQEDDETLETLSQNSELLE